jgi:hypothetical protein
VAGGAFVVFAASTVSTTGFPQTVFCKGPEVFLTAVAASRLTAAALALDVTTAGLPVGAPARLASGPGPRYLPEEVEAEDDEDTSRPPFWLSSGVLPAFFFLILLFTFRDLSRKERIKMVDFYSKIADEYLSS